MFQEKREREEDRERGREAKKRRVSTAGIPSEQRRWDSLARLLAPGSMCVCVTEIDNRAAVDSEDVEEKSLAKREKEEKEERKEGEKRELFITTNELRTLSQSNKSPFETEHAKYMRYVLHYFLKLPEKSKSGKNTDKDNPRLNCLREIIYQVFVSHNNAIKQAGSAANDPIVLDDNPVTAADCFDAIVETLLNDPEGHLTKENIGVEHFTEEEQTFWNNTNNQSFGNLSSKDKNERFRLKGKKNHIEKGYDIAWRFARDFKKVEEVFKKNTFDECTILAVGENGEHAEIRKIGFLLETGRLKLSKEGGATQSPIYMGLSKLCCPKCDTAVETVNQVALNNDINLSSITTTGDTDEDEEKTAQWGGTLNTRGWHGVNKSAKSTAASSGSQRNIPAYLDKQAYLTDTARRYTFTIEESGYVNEPPLIPTGTGTEKQAKEKTIQKHYKLRSTVKLTSKVSTALNEAYQAKSEESKSIGQQGQKQQKKRTDEDRGKPGIGALFATTISSLTASLSSSDAPMSGEGGGVSHPLTGQPSVDRMRHPDSEEDTGESGEEQEAVSTKSEAAPKKGGNIFDILAMVEAVPQQDSNQAEKEDSDPKEPSIAALPSPGGSQEE